MVTKNQIKFLKGLNQKKNRIKSKKILVEGDKIIREFIDSDYKLDKIYSTEPLKYQNYPNQKLSEKHLKSVSNLKSPSGDLAVFNLKDKAIENEKLYIVLDGINDPGNLGTIIRTCDWFGIYQIICSKNSVDCFSPKVIQSSMGSSSRVNVFYIDILEFINSKNIPIYGAVLNGEKLKNEIINNGIFIFGSESNGISEDILKKIEHKIKIPKYNKNVKTESLNLSVSLGIVLSKIRI